MLKLPLISARLFNQPLMISSAKLDEILHVLRPRLTGEVAAFESGGGGNPNPPYRVGNVMVIPIFGSLTKRTSIDDAVSGLTSYEAISNNLRMALGDDSVKSILLDIDSGGGEVAGNFDLVDMIYEARGGKPIWAIANEAAASAAYAIASAADKVIVTRTSVIGSVGVVAAHLDQSEADKQKGLKWTMVYAGAEKTSLYPHEPLSEGGRTTLQHIVNSTYDLFTKTVARNRGMNVEAVIETEARIYRGADALDVGFADEIMSFETVLASMNAGHFHSSSVTILKQERNTLMNIENQPAITADADPVAAPAASSAPAVATTTPSVDVSQAVKEALVQERVRASAILKQAAALKVSGEFAASLIHDGVDMAMASSKLIDEAAKNDGAAGVQASHAVKADGVDQSLPVEERAKQEWDSSPEIRAEFKDKYGAYLAFARREEKNKSKAA